MSEESLEEQLSKEIRRQKFLKVAHANKDKFELVKSLYLKYFPKEEWKDENYLRLLDITGEYLKEIIKLVDSKIVQDNFHNSVGGAMEFFREWKKELIFRSELEKYTYKADGSDR